MEHRLVDPPLGEPNHARGLLYRSALRAVQEAEFRYATRQQLLAGLDLAVITGCPVCWEVSGRPATWGGNHLGETLEEAQAVVLFPGGLGTQDENFETLTLIQTGKAELVPVVLCDAPGGSYWTSWLEYVEKQLLAKGMIGKDDMNLFKITDRAEDAVAEVVKFYRRYHSSRFVGDRFAIRLNSALSDETLSTLNGEFSDIITGGRFEQRPGPLEGEGDAYPQKPRLVFDFDRRSAGRLRLLINWLNDVP
ncbi:MAG: LOG family protein [Planctomycetes bacterium]|nr:LOG family protein [Planctomycetota bacterium]